MKRLALLSLVVLVPFAAAAGDDHETCKTHQVSAVVGVNSSGSIEFCVIHPGEVPAIGTKFQATATLTTSASLSGSNPTLTIVALANEGCTLPTPTTYATPPTNTQGPSKTVTWAINQTAKQCHLYLRATVTSGSTTLTELALPINVRVNTGLLETLGQFAYFWCGLYFVITRFIRTPQVPYASILRVLADIVALGILELPDLPETQFARIATFCYLLLIVDLFLLIQKPGAA